MIHAAVFENDVTRPTLVDCREQLERIRRSPDFNATKRVQNFLDYIVKETFRGRASRIKAYSVAVEVFGRGSTFDPQNDPIVRITANHLRRSLERYYLLSGSSDPVLVTIPKGCYAPIFTFRGGSAKGGMHDAEAEKLDAPLATSDFSQPPSPEDIRLQLERIIQSAEFPSSGRAASFLSYVVGEALAGRKHRIKGYSIAIEVFKRPASFTQDDPVVRIEAGRLRRALERYYLVAGQSDAIIIDIPKGGYVPTFAWNINAPSSHTCAGSQTVETRAGYLHGKYVVQLLAGLGLIALGVFTYAWWPDALHYEQQEISQKQAPERPSLIVASLQDLGEGSQTTVYAGGITEELLTTLARFKEIKVFGRETTQALSPTVDPSEIGKRLGADYLLSGGVRTSQSRLRVTARLTDTSNGEILWSHTYDSNLRVNDPIAVQSDVANRVASTVAQSNGIIARVELSTSPPDDLQGSECISRFYAYRAELSSHSHMKIRACLENAVAQYPTHATAWAMLSIAYLDEVRFGFNQRPGSSPLNNALQTARHAVQLDPNNVRSLQALMMALLFNQQFPEAMRIGEQALAANPNDTELLAEFGMRVAMSGDWQRGAMLLDRAIELDPAGGARSYGPRALAAFFLNDKRTAIVAIEQADLQNFPMFHAIAAMIYADAGMRDEARREGRLFMKMHPRFIPNLEAELRMRFYRRQDRLRVIEALRKAELPMRPAPETAFRAPKQ